MMAAGMKKRFMTKRAVPLLCFTILTAYATGGCARYGRISVQRQAGYQDALRAYSEALEPGATRASVEAYLQNGGAAFRRWTGDGAPSAYDDFVKIGSEQPPWFCNERNIYVMFAFKQFNPGYFGHHPGDTLVGVSLIDKVEGCL
jgi:hypothetical protein